MSKFYLTTWEYLKTWFELIRIFNVPIPLAGMLVGAYSVSPNLSGNSFLLLCICALLGCAATQSYNDYGDSEVDAQNADFRPIPSQRLSKTEVIIGGHLFTLMWIIISLINSITAGLIIVIVYCLTRWYSWAKKVTLIHHLLLPMALGLMPIYGSFLIAEHTSKIAVIAGISIFLIDTNMNIVGAFKDIWDGCADECVLPLIWDKRKSVILALILGVIGIFVQMEAIILGLCQSIALIPLCLGLILTLNSRIRLYLNPIAEVGYAALKSGRLTECLTFPALLLSLSPLVTSSTIITGLTVFALFTQSIITEAKVPE